MVLEFERIHTLGAGLEDCKLKCVTNFDSGFNTLVVQIQVLHPGIDLSGMDFDKIVADGRLVHAPNEEEQLQQEMDKAQQDPPLDLGPSHQEPNVEDDNLATLVREPEPGYLSANAKRLDIVMDTPDHEATP